MSKGNGNSVIEQVEGSYGKWRKANKTLIIRERGEEWVSITRRTPSQGSSYLEQVASTSEGENCFVANKPQCGMKGHGRGGNVDQRDKKE